MPTSRSPAGAGRGRPRLITLPFCAHYAAGYDDRATQAGPLPASASLADAVVTLERLAVEAAR